MALYGLIDGNSFYCSCEQAFDPALRDKPVVVLSNNDGCVIARSALAKAVGIKMGDPWHLIRRRPELSEVVAKSSNYSHYGDLSRRVFEILGAHVQRLEPYSIDETFLDLAPVTGDLMEFCQMLRGAVRQIAKIPTCVGVGPSKTIAKAANKLAKSRPELNGVCDLRDEATRVALYQDLGIGEVWGIGGKTAEKLAARGVRTVADFLRLDPRKVRDMMSVVGARVQAELRDVSCLPLSLMAPQRKGIAVTRSFGMPITDWWTMREAVASYATRAGEKLREHGLLASTMTVLLHTNPHNGDPWYSNQHSARIEATNDTTSLIGEAIRMLEPMWRAGFRYSKAGIMLGELIDAGSQPMSLFPTKDPVRSARAMAALDAVNGRFGRDTLRPLATGISRTWTAKAMNLSPRYTTRVGEILVGTAY
ncbi:Y-family DNA polymerase [Acidiphilium acidophilum]|uniref:DNA-directed DNA polymerase n=2 Tax=Acidiphilium TaxID=522 RepID=A0AAW9DJY8_ACIAO|nr:Y-family DNA polymerase [Acidiphilium acidophilum]MDX5929323.1 Y-family DNA polymerase [Acidiphilium acidophilum]